MKYAWLAIFSILVLALGILSNAIPYSQPTYAAKGQLLFHFTDIPWLGQNVIIKLSGKSGTMQWREWLIPILSDTVTKRVSGFNSGEYLTVCLTTIGGTAKKVRSCDSERFDTYGGTDFFLSVSGKAPRQFN